MKRKFTVTRHKKMNDKHYKFYYIIIIILIMGKMVR